MARGRLISRTLGSSRKYAALRGAAAKLGEFCQALYPMIVANSDDFGRMAGDAFTVKHAVFPTSPRPESDFGAALEAMNRVGLIHWYQAEGAQVVQIVDFDEHQPGLSKRTKSKFPAFSREFTGIPSQLNGIEPKGTEPKGTALRADVSGFEEFWSAYPKKKSRADAERAWRKLAPSPELCQRIKAAVAAQRVSADWTKDDGKYIPYPASWLNGQRWEDVLEVAIAAPAREKRECPHTPPCHSPVWCEVVTARERGVA